MTQTREGNLSSRVMKAMSVFGGVQVLNILCSVVRTKLVAMWIGAAGVGLFGLYNATIEMICSITQLGLRNSAVRDIASSSEQRLPLISRVVRRWAWALGVLGAITTLALSPLLSEWTFGDDSHTTGFIILAIVIMLASVTNGELAIMQGTNRLKQLARASVWGVLAGLAVSVPMFYFWRIESVIPSIVAYSVVTAIATYIYRKRTLSSAVPSLTLKETFNNGRSFIVLGLYMTISAFAAMAASYIFMAYLNNTSDTATVGYYQAGFTLVNRYVGLIFTAIAMEYYPRLAKAGEHPLRTSTMVSHEIKLVLWILLPVIATFITANNLIINILYTSDFQTISPFITWAIVGMVFRAVSWCMAFVILARGDGRLYLITEGSSAAISLALHITAFNLWGLDGLGWAYIVWYVIYTLIVGSIYRWRYNMRLGRGIKTLIVFATATSILAAVLSSFAGWWAALIVALTATGLAVKRLVLKR